MSRIETGPIKFGEDWTGVFIRGDNAITMAADLEILDSMLGPNNFYRDKLKYIIDVLTSCAEGKEDVIVQHIDNFTHAVLKK